MGGRCSMTMFSLPECKIELPSGWYQSSIVSWWLKVSLWNLSKPFFFLRGKKGVGFFPPDVLFVSWRVTPRWSHQKNTFRWLNLPFAMNTYPFQSAQWGKYPPENWHKYPPWMDAWKIFSARLPAFYTLTKLGGFKRCLLKVGRLSQDLVLGLDTSQLTPGFWSTNSTSWLYPGVKNLPIQEGEYMLKLISISLISW